MAKLAGRPVEPLRAEDITQQALAGQSECIETLNLYCKFLGRITGDYALAYGATGGVFLGGGILRNFPARGIFQKIPHIYVEKKTLAPTHCDLSLGRLGSL